jgi:hypothetical protein
VPQQFAVGLTWHFETLWILVLLLANPAPWIGVQIHASQNHFER